MRRSGQHNFLPSLSFRPWRRSHAQAFTFRFDPRIYQILGTGAILLGMVIILLPKEPVPNPPPPPPPPFLSGWALSLTEKPSGAQARGFERTYKPGQAAFVPAGSSFILKAQPAKALGAFLKTSDAWDHAGGELEVLDSGIRFTAPQVPGPYRLRWEGAPSKSGHDHITLIVQQEAQVAARSGKFEVLVGGQTIGKFGNPKTSTIEHVRKNADRYGPPKFFTSLNASSTGIFVDGIHTLGQFVAYSTSTDSKGRKVFTRNRHTQFLPPNPDLYFKLSALRDKLRESGINVTRFWITSGFRTPAYNRKIGGALFSRHCYGDAVDICIDENGDRHMDDLNNDGRLDRKDGIVIAKACLELEAQGLVTPGGIGVYEYDGEDSVRSHVHIDCRGFTARWGQAHRGRGKSSFDWWSSLEKQQVIESHPSR